MRVEGKKKPFNTTLELDSHRQPGCTDADDSPFFIRRGRFKRMEKSSTGRPFVPSFILILGLHRMRNREGGRGWRVLVEGC